MQISNKVFIGAIIVILLVGGSIFFLMNSSRSSSEKDMMLPVNQNTSGSLQDNTVQNEPGDSIPPSGSEQVTELPGSSGTYVSYSQSNYNNAENKKRVLFFYASWCPTCRPADSEFGRNEDQIPDDVSLIRVNYNDPDTDDEEAALAKKYNVTYQHTFVQIDSDGNEVTKWNGGGIDELLDNLK